MYSNGNYCPGFWNNQPFLVNSISMCPISFLPSSNGLSFLTAPKWLYVLIQFLFQLHQAVQPPGRLDLKTEWTLHILFWKINTHTINFIGLNNRNICLESCAACWLNSATRRLRKCVHQLCAAAPKHHCWSKWCTVEITKHGNN